MLIVGDKEIDNHHVSVRHKGEGDKGAMGVEEFITRALEEIKKK
jgi:threonyl-tRNA synthetase